MSATAQAAPPGGVEAEAKAKATFSAGAVKLLEPVVSEMDARTDKILASQEVLTKQLEAFSAALGQFEGVGVAPHLSQYSEKLNLSRRKLHKVDMCVQNTRERVENIRRMHTQLLAFEKSQKERRMAQQGKGEGAAEQPAAPKAEGPAKGEDSKAEGEGVGGGAEKPAE
eukprot:CAMPEP_0174924602 /NCGR_PEP_ID=MMETSP1355-20121228/7352_1 /TAXON_ID=464990 /ORGANISM="Hemiselmis tepida, Strain CCMP443" /LENGTH=168 /DNA_ID=CAMNT_0016170423 /DNA_START=23 /DNA_END=529 /DNA_ORIENTATION=-